MDPQVPQQSPQPSTNPPLHSSNLPLIIGALVLIVLVGTGTYFLGMQRGQNDQRAIDVEKTLLPPGPSPTPINETEEWIEYRAPSVKSLSFSDFSISYPSSWTKEVTYTDGKSVDSGYTLSLTKNDHILKIFQGAFGGAVCVFEGEEMFEGPAADYRGKPYSEISSYAPLRRVQIASEGPQRSFYEVCGKGSERYQAPLAMGAVSYETSLTPDPSLLKEMDSILSTIKLLK